MKKKIGDLYRLDNGICELWEVVGIQELEDGDKLTFRSRQTKQIRLVDEFSYSFPFQGPEIEYTTPAGIHFFDRLYLYFSKNAPQIAWYGPHLKHLPQAPTALDDQVEYFKDSRNDRFFAVMSNTENQVFQIGRFRGLRPDERSRMNEVTFESMQIVFSLSGDDVIQLPFALRWVKCFGVNEDLPTEFDLAALPECRASDGASVLAILDKVAALG